MGHKLAEGYKRSMDRANGYLLDFRLGIFFVSTASAAESQRSTCGSVRSSPELLKQL
jgi:hypothetical protein